MLHLFLAEAKFHVLVDRKELRKDNAAWERVAKSESMEIPSEFQSWVGEKSVSMKATEEGKPTELATAAKAA